MVCTHLLVLGVHYIHFPLLKGRQMAKSKLSQLQRKVLGNNAKWGSKEVRAVMQLITGVLIERQGTGIIGFGKSV